MKIKLQVIGNDAGGMAVLTPEHRLNATLRALRRRATKLTEDAKTLTGKPAQEALDEAKSYEKLADDTEADWKEIQKKYAANSTELEFEIRAYTYGEKLAARKAATTWNGNMPGHFDNEEFLVNVVSAVTGKSRIEVESMPPVVFGYLASEICELSEPEPGKLDFLVSSPSV